MLKIEIKIIPKKRVLKQYLYKKNPEINLKYYKTRFLVPFNNNNKQQEYYERGEFRV